MTLRRLGFVWLTVALVVLSGCASVPERPVSADRATQNALSMVGKPYHFGGNSPQQGFDCSGLVQWSYGRVGVRLPHGTDRLRQVSKKIPSSSLRRGDLLFFTQAGKPSSHVAIYIGDDRFVHAPSSGKRVYVGDFNDRYWKKYFDEARRIDSD